MQNPEVFQDDFSDDPNHCTACGNAVKRRSPSSSSFLDSTTTSDSEPKPKKIMLQDDHSPLRGFNNVDLPISFPINPNPNPILRRCVSDPYHSPGTTANNTNSPPNQIVFSDSGTLFNFNPQSPEKSALKFGTPLSPGKPPLPPPPMLNRTLSDRINPASPPPKLLRNNSISSSNTVDGGFGFSVPVDEDSPNLKRVRRMKERMKQMHQWWNEVMLEGDDDASQSQEDINNNSNPNTNTNTNPNNAIQDDFGEADEQVCVERLGECLCINFKCQCTKGYQILLSGNKIYYKLI